MQRFRQFVANAHWRFARTYVESYPHEYTLQRSVGAEPFSRAIACIERWGVVETFYGAKRKYLYVDDRKYWHMGDACSGKSEDQPTLVNRTWLDVGRYAEDARALGYGGETVDRLVERWKVLLERARGGH